MFKRSIPRQVKAFIIEALARFETPQMVAADVRERYCLLISDIAIASLDPTRPEAHELSAAERALFDEARARHLADVENIGIVHKATRLRLLNRICGTAEDRGEFDVVLKILVNAAKEVGSFLNRQAPEAPTELKPRDPGPEFSRIITERYAKALRDFKPNDHN
jgi:hypothetical protein